MDADHFTGYSTAASHLNSRDVRCSNSIDCQNLVDDYNTSYSGYKSTVLQKDYHNMSIYDVYLAGSHNETASNIIELSESGKIVLGVFYGLVIVVALGGNTLIILVIVVTRRLRTVTNLFIASQSLSDSLMSFLCVPWSFLNNVMFDSWNLPDLLCPVVLYSQSASVFLSAFMMLAISMDRYRAVISPLKPRLTKNMAAFVIIVTWLLALAVSLPIAVFASTFERPIGSNVTVCDENWPNDHYRHLYTWAVLLLQYFIPLFILTFTYSRIAVVVWGRRTPGEAINDRDRRVETGKKKMISMMITVVVIYAVCWLPIHLVSVVGEKLPQLWRWRYVHLFWVFSHFLAMSSCCYNPVVYFAMNSKFRDALWSVFCLRCSPCCPGAKAAGRLRHASGVSCRVDGRLVSGTKVNTKEIWLHNFDSKNSKGMSKEDWRNVSRLSSCFSGTKDDICMNDLTPGEHNKTLNIVDESKLLDC